MTSIARTGISVNRGHHVGWANTKPYRCQNLHYARCPRIYRCVLCTERMRWKRKFIDPFKWVREESRVSHKENDGKPHRKCTLACFVNCWPAFMRLIFFQLKRMTLNAAFIQSIKHIFCKRSAKAKAATILIAPWRVVDKGRRRAFIYGVEDWSQLPRTLFEWGLRPRLQNLMFDHTVHLVNFWCSKQARQFNGIYGDSALLCRRTTARASFIVKVDESSSKKSILSQLMFGFLSDLLYCSS